MRGTLIIGVAVLTGCTTVAPREPAPNAEVGVAFESKGEIASFAEDLADGRNRRAVTPDDPVRVASISKLVVGVGVMKLVEQGKLDLDSDVSRWLGWSLRNPAFPDRAVTLRMLLSHTSSVRDHDDQYAIPLGETVQGAMADARSWDAHHGPGDRYFTYSNMNFPIVASIIERVTGDRFDVWMRREVLEPMKLDACYNWSTCSDATVARAVELDQDGKPVKDDLHGARPACPVAVKEGVACDLSLWKEGENGALFAPQGGLRISARGLARVGRMLLNEGTLDGVTIISAHSVDTLLAPLWRYDGTNGDPDPGYYCSFGLASQQIPAGSHGCSDDMGTRGVTLVGHAGDAYGMKSGLWLDRRGGRGIAYFVTGVPEKARRDGHSAWSAAEVGTFRRTYAKLMKVTQTSSNR